MSVRESIAARLQDLDPERAARAALPMRLRPENMAVRAGLLRRLAASRHFALGDRSGTLSAAQRRSGRVFRLDVRQRVIVKALVSRHVGLGVGRGAALAKHVAYLGRQGAGVEAGRAEFFDASRDGLDGAVATKAWSDDRHHFRLIVSPEHGDRIADLRGYVREVMVRVSADLGEPNLTWMATCHYDTDQPHAHVMVRGRRGDGRDLVMPRAYVGYGLRARAQEVAHERLGDLSRAEAERRVWRETDADRFTALDRRLVAGADLERRVEDGLGRKDAWGALLRGRLRHLERLGLAGRIGASFRLAPDLEPRLRSLERGKDIIRTLNQRRLEGARDIRVADGRRLEGLVVARGTHDELGASPFVVVRDRGGAEHYARLAPGRMLPEVGREIALAGGERGIFAIVAGRGGPELTL